MALPVLTAEIDFQGNPTATYADIQKTADDVQGFWRCNSSSTFNDERGLNNGTVSGSPSTTAGPYPYDSDRRDHLRRLERLRLRPGLGDALHQGRIHDHGLVQDGEHPGLPRSTS